MPRAKVLIAYIKQPSEGKEYHSLTVYMEDGIKKYMSCWDFGTMADVTPGIAEIYYESKQKGDKVYYNIKSERLSPTETFSGINMIEKLDKQGVMSSIENLTGKKQYKPNKVGTHDKENENDLVKTCCERFNKAVETVMENQKIDDFPVEQKTMLICNLSNQMKGKTYGGM